LRLRDLAAFAALAVAVAGCSVLGRAGATDLPAATEIAAGERFEVRLASNPSTGYSWALRGGADGKVVRLVGSTFVPPAPPASGPAPVGQEGNEVFTFEGVAAGRATIEFAYARPWEKDVAPAKVVQQVVRVR